ncbi:hypothetical protein [Denitrobacterium detoxificans]|uniref:Uncharacterized protein n=1 Tax=Denitrobacterium detoxificans TaxID=79604 RepID=A0A1H8QHA7_9ACTN|nr:hypothetical protein [Denitrobacterium detoxificans]SEO53615.1 hypothetical protein SAMN02910314_00488 [Denitrobacterium detoxificans]
MEYQDHAVAPAEAVSCTAQDGECPDASNNEEIMTKALDCPSDPEVVFAEVCSHLSLNRSNTLPMCACMNACRESVSYREVEVALADEPVMNMSTQTPHTLLRILIDAGAIDATPIYEEDVDPEAEDARAYDYELVTSEAGLRALEQYDPCARFAQLIEEEPEGYADAYRIVLDTCREAVGLPAIETALSGHPALYSPKTVFAGYFVSKLETVGGIVWDGAWRTTEEGIHMADSIPVCA